MKFFILLADSTRREMVHIMGLNILMFMGLKELVETGQVSYKG